MVHHVVQASDQEVVHWVRVESEVWDQIQVHDPAQADAQAQAPFQV